MKLHWEDIENRFSYHKPTDVNTSVNHEEVRESLKSVTQKIIALIPAGREASVFVTKMEEAMFWANAAIARNK